MASVSEHCRASITALKSIISTLFDPDRQNGRVHHEQVSDELERLSLWMGNIGALHRPEHPMSLESRLREANDVLIHILELLDNLHNAAGERECFASCITMNELTWFSFGDRLRRARRGDSFYVT
jgi:hypothetical protein